MAHHTQTCHQIQAMAIVALHATVLCGPWPTCSSICLCVSWKPTVRCRCRVGTLHQVHRALGRLWPKHPHGAAIFDVYDLDSPITHQVKHTPVVLWMGKSITAPSDRAVCHATHLLHTCASSHGSFRSWSTHNCHGRTCFLQLRMCLNTIVCMLSCLNWQSLFSIQ